MNWTRPGTFSFATWLSWRFLRMAGAFKAAPGEPPHPPRRHTMDRNDQQAINGLFSKLAAAIVLSQCEPLGVHMKYHNP